MSRRGFLKLLAGGAIAGVLPACRAPGLARPGRPGAIAAVAFDLFTIFDPRSVEAAVAAEVPGEGPELARQWRARQFEYAFVRAAADQYADFRRVTDDALVVTARARGHELGAATRARLVDAYQTLAPWPDSIEVLRELRGRGLRLAPLANYAPAMLHALLVHGGIAALFEDELSTDRVKSFKPHPRAYQLGVDSFGLPREQIAFAAFGGWDAAGATWFGYPTFWVNRLGIAQEALVSPTATGPDLTAFAGWLSERAAGRTASPGSPG